MSFGVLTPSDLDADWALFDNVQTVTLYIFNSSTETYGSAQSTVQALVPPQMRKQDAVEDGSVFVQESTIDLRASTVTGFPDRGSKIVDVSGNTWIVNEEGAEYTTWKTRIKCHVNQA